MIRLREPEDSSSFLPWESMLGTMLHELCHIAIGAHSADFYKLLDELWTEIESSNTTLWSGSNKASAVGSSYSFDGAYRKLGSSSAGSSAPGKDLKRLAAEAALKRQAFNAVSNSSSSGGSGGYRLGGAPLPSSSSSSSSSDWKTLATAAAERRRLDDVACDGDVTLPPKSQTDGSADGWICEICLEENAASPMSASCYFCGGLTQAEKKEYSLLTSNSSSTEALPIPPGNKGRGILMKRQLSAELCLPCPTPRSPSPGTSDSISGKRSKAPPDVDIVDLTSSAEPTPRLSERERIELQCSACTFINSVYIGDVSSSCEICGTGIAVIDEET